MNTRQTIFVSVVVLLLALLGAWWYFGFSLDFMRFFAAEPGVTDTTGGAITTPRTTSLTRQPLPPTCELSGTSVVCQQVACIAASQTVTVGAIVNIQAYGGTDGYVFAAPGGTMAMSQNRLDVVGVKYDTAGVKQVLVTAKRASDPTQTDVATCRVTVVPAAVTN